MLQNVKVVVLVGCLLVAGMGMTIDLKQPSLISWTINNKTSNLFVYNLQKQQTLSLLKISDSPIDYLNYSSTFIISNKNAYFYKPVTIQYNVNVQYFYDSWDGISQNGVIKGSSLDLYDCGKQKIDQQNSSFSNNQNLGGNFKICRKQSQSFKQTKIFDVRPMILHQNTELSKQIMFQIDQDVNTYQIPSQIFSLVPVCKKIYPFTDKTLKLQSSTCLPITAKSIIDNNLYNNKYLINNIKNSSNLSLPVDSKQLGLYLDINSSIIGSNIKVQPLAGLMVDFSKIIISIKNFKDGLVQKIKITVDNIGSTFAYIGLKCVQNGQVLYISNLLIQQNSYQIFQIPLSKSKPSSMINFMLTNPLTNQFYTFNNPSTIVKDIQWTTFQLKGNNYQPVSSVSVALILGGAFGGVFLLSILSVFVYRKMRKQQFSKKSQKAANLTISDRQFINSITTNNNNTQPHSPILQTFRKQKPQTSTTIDSSALEQRISYETRSNLQNEQYKQKVPSLEDKLQFRQQCQLQLPNFRTNRRASSTAQLFQTDSNNFKNNFLSRSSKGIWQNNQNCNFINQAQNLDKIKV